MLDGQFRTRRCRAQGIRHGCAGRQVRPPVSPRRRRSVDIQPEPLSRRGRLTRTTHHERARHPRRNPPPDFGTQPIHADTARLDEPWPPPMQTPCPSRVAITEGVHRTVWRCLAETPWPVHCTNGVSDRGRVDHAARSPGHRRHLRASRLNRCKTCCHRAFGHASGQARCRTLLNTTQPDRGLGLRIPNAGRKSHLAGCTERAGCSPCLTRPLSGRCGFR